MTAAGRPGQARASRDTGPLLTRDAARISTTPNCSAYAPAPKAIPPYAIVVSRLAAEGSVPERARAPAALD